MRSLSISFLILTLMGFSTLVNAQTLEENAELASNELAEVIDIVDFDQIMAKISSQKELIKKEPTFLNKVKLGILYHDGAMQLVGTKKAARRELAEESYTLLSILATESSKQPHLLPFVKAYQASSLGLLGAANTNNDLIKQSFVLFDQTIDQFGKAYYVPLYLRAKIAENLPYPYNKKRWAKTDYSNLINWFESNSNSINNRTMIQTYLAWAKLHANKKDYSQAVQYLEEAIKLGQDNNSTVQKAKELLQVMENEKQRNL